MTTKSELAAERRLCETKVETAQRVLSKAQARIAEIDAQLARPVLPAGWVDASEPPKYGRYVLALVRRPPLVPDRERVIIAFFGDDGVWRLPMNADRINMPAGFPILAWRELPDDWLAPAEARYPRYFKSTEDTWPLSAYVRIDGEDKGVCVRRDGTERQFIGSEKHAETYAAAGDWREITAAEAEAMVKPVVKESLTAEATTEQLAKAFDRVSDGGREMQAVDYDAIRARILAFDHSVDLRGVWCLKPDECKDGKWRLAYLVSRHERRVGMAVWVGGRWHDQCGALSAYTAVERLADPAAFMPKGGGE